MRSPSLKYTECSASDLKGLGSCGYPHFPYSTKNSLQEKMTQGLQASLFTQGHKSISGEAFKINCLLTLSFPFFFWPPPSPTSTHTHHLLWRFNLTCGARLERGTPSSEHTSLTPAPNCSTTALPSRKEDLPRQCLGTSALTQTLQIALHSLSGALTPLPK